MRSSLYFQHSSIAIALVSTHIGGGTWQGSGVSRAVLNSMKWTFNYKAMTLYVFHLSRELLIWSTSQLTGLLPRNQERALLSVKLFGWEMLDAIYRKYSGHHHHRKAWEKECAVSPTVLPAQLSCCPHSDSDGRWRSRRVLAFFHSCGRHESSSACGQ